MCGWCAGLGGGRCVVTGGGREPKEICIHAIITHTCYEILMP